MRPSLVAAVAMLFLGSAAACALPLSPDSFGLVALAWIGLLTAYLAARHPDIATALVVGYVVRAAFALIQAHVMPLPGSGADDLTFRHNGWLISQGELPWNVLDRLSAGGRVYDVIVASVYALVGRSDLTVQSISVVAGMLAIVEAYRLSRMVWGRQSGYAAAWAVALFPTVVLYSVHTLREALVAYLGLLGTRHLISFLRSRGIRSGISVFAAYAAAGTLHNGFMLLLPLSGLLAALMPSEGTRRPLSGAAKAAMLALGVALTVIALNTGWGMQKFQAIIDQPSAEAMGAHQRSVGGARYLQDMPPIRTFTDILVQAPRRTAHYLFSPFPWSIRSAHQVIGCFDGQAYIILVALTVLKRRRIARSSGGKALVAIVSVLTFCYMMGTSNFGTAIRHRMKMLPILICLASVYFEGGAAKQGPGIAEQRVAQDAR